MACGIQHTLSWYYNHVIQNENSFVDHPLLVPLLLTFSYASGSLGSILRLDSCAKAGLHAEQERRKAAIDASVEMSAVSAVPDSMEDRNELRRVDIWAVCEKSPKMKWQVFSFFALNCESSKSGVPFGRWGLQWTWFWARCQWIGCSNSGGEKMIKHAASSLCVANFHRHVFSKAELEGDDETLGRLRAEQARRDARGEHARETGVRSVGARNPRRIPRSFIKSNL